MPYPSKLGGLYIGESLCRWCHSAQWQRYWRCVLATWCEQSFSDIAWGTDQASLCGAVKVSKLRNHKGVLSVPQLPLFRGRCRGCPTDVSEAGQRQRWPCRVVHLCHRRCWCRWTVRCPDIAELIYNLEFDVSGSDDWSGMVLAAGSLEHHLSVLQTGCESAERWAA